MMCSGFVWKQFLCLVGFGCFLCLVGCGEKRSREENVECRGRVLSQEAEPECLLRVMANVAAADEAAVMKVVEVEVSEAELGDFQVGSEVDLFVNRSGEARLRSAGGVSAGVSGETSQSAFLWVLCLLVLLLGLGWWIWSRVRHARELAELAKAGPLRHVLQKPLKSSTLYQGALEFSYAEEKTRVELSEGLVLRVSQYRPLEKLSSVLKGEDLLTVLREAKSDWKIAEGLGMSGEELLEKLVSKGKVSEGDQFFVNENHLGLLSREESDTGQWHSWVRGVWELPADEE